MQFIAERLSAASLLIWTHIVLIQVSIFNLQSIQVDSLFWLQEYIRVIFYLRGCVPSSYLALDLLDHHGTLTVGFLAKNCTGWTTHLDHSAQLIRR